MFRVRGVSLLMVVYFAAFIPFSAYTKLQLQQSHPDLLKVGSEENLSAVSVSMLDGQKQTLGDIAKSNKLTIVQFWATWCVECRLALPHLAKVYQRQHPEGLEVVAVSIDDSLETVTDYTKKVSLPFPIAIDSDGALRRQFEIQGVPVALALDKDGKLLSVHSGADEDLDRTVDTWLQLLK